MKIYSKKLRSFSNEVTCNNAKWPFAGQLAESFWLGNISIYLKPAVLQICKIGYLSMIEGSFTDFSALYTVLKLEKWLAVFWNSSML